MRGFFLAIFCCFIACQQIPPKPEFHELIGDNRVKEILCPFEVQYLDGLAWGPDQSLYFSDVAAGRIYRYKPGNGFSMVCDSTEGVNGMMFDHSGNLVVCQGKYGYLARFAPGSCIQDTLATAYGGERFNSPNDLVVDGHNGVYFTDPSFTPDHHFQTKEAVYYITPENEIRALINDIHPDGIALSLDSKILYLADRKEPFIWAFDVLDRGRLFNRRILYHLKDTESKEGEIRTATGMTIDVKGNLFLCTHSGIIILDAHGRYLGKISMDAHPANCAFGGTNLNILYITASNSLYQIKTNTNGRSLS
jgi:gluconolactonase